MSYFPLKNSLYSNVTTKLNEISLHVVPHTSLLSLLSPFSLPLLASLVQFSYQPHFLICTNFAQCECHYNYSRDYSRQLEHMTGWGPDELSKPVYNVVKQHYGFCLIRYLQRKPMTTKVKRSSLDLFTICLSIGND